jgi:hypothetical protein
VSRGSGASRFPLLYSVGRKAPGRPAKRSGTGAAVEEVEEEKDEDKDPDEGDAGDGT